MVFTNTRRVLLVLTLRTRYKYIYVIVIENRPELAMKNISQFVLESVIEQAVATNDCFCFKLPTISNTPTNANCFH